MNRKERRAAGSRAAALPQGIDALSADARRLFDQGRFAQAQKICREVIERAPAHVESLNLLGLIAQDAGRHTAAVRFFEKAIAADSYNAACHFNLGTSYQALNERAQAAAHFREAIALGLSGRDVGDLILQSPVIAACLDRIAAAWPRRPSTAELFGAPAIAALANDVFLCCALETTKFTRIALETFFTEARHALLQIAAAAAPDWRGVEPGVADFCAALAQQCFINEYIYALGDEEARQAAALRDALAEALNAAADVPPLLVAIVAAYAPLHALTNAQALLQRQWPDTLAGLLRQQIEEPQEEAQDRDAIPVLTAIAEDSAVRRQYEENPYPRWTMMLKDAPALDGESVRRFGPEGDVPPADILVAGCGTGHHSITTAMLYPEANVLAIDISRASLAFARRKTREAGVRNVEYAQADIMKLGAIGKSFDRIEAIGVLHHLDDPLTGWRTLLPLLRPGGVMVVGLYSAMARQGINAARAFAAERGYRPTAEDIRACRQELIHRERAALRYDVSSLGDFYSMSECRDLLFNVMEHQFTIPGIKAFLAAERLSFHGFELDQPARAKFRQQYPGADALTDLDRWERFEAAHPQTFINMYVFYVRPER